MAKESNDTLFSLIDAAYNAHAIDSAEFEASLLEGAKLLQADKEPQAVKVLYDALATLTSEQRMSVPTLGPLLADVQARIARNRQTIGNGIGLAYIAGSFF